MRKWLDWFEYNLSTLFHTQTMPSSSNDSKWIKYWASLTSVKALSSFAWQRNSSKIISCSQTDFFRCLKRFCLQVSHHSPLDSSSLSWSKYSDTPTSPSWNAEGAICVGSKFQCTWINPFLLKHFAFTIKHNLPTSLNQISQSRPDHCNAIYCRYYSSVQTVFSL